MSLRMRVAAMSSLILVVSGVGIALAVPASAATGQICIQYGTTTQGNYVVMNNRWGTSATQCINVTTSGPRLVGLARACYASAFGSG